MNLCCDKDDLLSRVSGGFCQREVSREEDGERIEGDGGDDGETPQSAENLAGGVRVVLRRHR